MAYEPLFFGGDNAEVWGASGSLKVMNPRTKRLFCVLCFREDVVDANGKTTFTCGSLPDMPESICWGFRQSFNRHEHQIDLGSLPMFGTPDQIEERFDN